MHSFDKRPLTENSQRISVSVFVRNFYLELKKKAPDNKRVLLGLNNEEFVRDLIEMIEKRSAINLKQEINGKIEFTEPNKIQLAYTKSNLGKGFIFWFICNVCKGRIRYLYFPPNSQILACRKCHGLAYERQNDSKSTRHLNRLFGV